MSDMDKRVVQKTNRMYWDIKGNDFLQAIVLPYYGAYISEEKWQLAERAGMFPVTFVIKARKA